MGGYAEFICLPVGQNDSVGAARPPNMTLEQAVAVPFGGMEALHFLRKAEIQPDAPSACKRDIISQR